MSDPPSTSTDAPLDVAGDRPAASAPPTRSRSAILAAEMRAQVALGRTLAAAGRDVELHGSVVNEAGGRVAAAYGFVGATASLLALVWPLRAGLLLAAVAGAGVIDLDNRWSWLRRLVPRDIGRTVLLWQPAPRPGAHPAAEPAEPDPEAGAPSRPLILLCLPVDAERPREFTVLSAAPLGGGIGLALFSALLHGLGVAFAADALTLAALVLCCVGFVGLIRDRVVRGSVEPGSGGRLATRLLDALDEQPLRHTDLAIAVVGGGSLFHDGAETLLRNHAPRLPAARTRVLAWEPAEGALKAIPQDGRVRRVEADAVLLGAADRAGLQRRPGATAAGRATRLGWRALGLSGGNRDLPAVAGRLLDILRDLDGVVGARP